MKLLLDTHTLVWWFLGDVKLSRKARAEVLNDDNPVFVSAASTWEIATKYRLGKLPEAGEVYARFEELVAADGFSYVSVSAQHGLRAGSYAVDHGDPFDRMLAAQAEIENLTLVTSDRAFRDFPIRTLW